MISSLYKFLSLCLDVIILVVAAGLVVSLTVAVVVLLKKGDDEHLNTITSHVAASAYEALVYGFFIVLFIGAIIFFL